MYKIAVMGDRDSIYGFAALGLDTFPVTAKEEAAETLKKLAQGAYAIVYMTEHCVQMLAEEVERYSAEQIPAILPIPGVSQNTGAGIGNVKRMVEQAVGSDIIFNNN